VTDLGPVPPDGAPLAALSGRLAAAGCVAAEEEAAELRKAAGGDPARLDELVERRLEGEPLAWVTGTVAFCGYRVTIRPGVFVPRSQTEVLARRATELLRDDGLAADLCAGSGAVALVLSRARPRARVVASEIDPLACECARQNGVECYCGHLGEPIPPELVGHFDVVTAVTPYVPSDEIQYLPRDARDYEPLAALDGGPGGTAVLEEAAVAARRLLHPGGMVLLELGGRQDEALSSSLARHGFEKMRPLIDGDGDLCGIEARRI
jgi:release factor glutamine methyltransferase